MSTNDFTMYVAIAVVAYLLINNLYQKIGMFRAKSKGAVYNKIDPSVAKSEIDKNRSVVVIDTRTPNEYKTGHIKKAKNIFSVKEITAKYPDKDTVLFLYCQSGSRSVKIAKKLVIRGYTQIYDIGGLYNWSYGTTKK